MPHLKPQHFISGGVSLQTAPFQQICSLFVQFSNFQVNGFVVKLKDFTSPVEPYPTLPSSPLQFISSPTNIISNCSLFSDVAPGHWTCRQMVSGPKYFYLHGGHLNPLQTPHSAPAILLQVL